MQRLVLLLHPIDPFGEGTVPHLQRRDITLNLFEFLAELDDQPILPDDLLDVLLANLISLLVQLLHLVAGLLQPSLHVDLAASELLTVPAGVRFGFLDLFAELFDGLLLFDDGAEGSFAQTA